ncbi:hypothetical protein Rsub_10496, partial [Raphidocelis subcapitata]
CAGAAAESPPYNPICVELLDAPPYAMAGLPLSFTIRVTSRGGATPESTVAVWSNNGQQVQCEPLGPPPPAPDATYRLPPLPPDGSVDIRATVVPGTPASSRRGGARSAGGGDGDGDGGGGGSGSEREGGEEGDEGKAVLRVLVDPNCTVSPVSDSEEMWGNQRTAQYGLLPPGPLPALQAAAVRLPGGPRVFAAAAPPRPVAGAKFSATFWVRNDGPEPILPNSVRLEVFNARPEGLYQTDCDAFGDGGGSVPPLAPGESGAVVVSGITAAEPAPPGGGGAPPRLVAVIDAGCATAAAKLPGRRVEFEYEPLPWASPVVEPAAAAAGAGAGGAVGPEAGRFSAKTAATGGGGWGGALKVEKARPKAGGGRKLRLRLEVANTGGGGGQAGAVGTVYVWLRRLEPGQEAWPYFGGAPCAYSGFNASAPFQSRWVSPGKSRSLRLRVPTPAEAGRYLVSAVPDGVCGTAAAGYVTLVPAYAEVEVI